jgi:salicylate hydroxylase
VKTNKSKGHVLIAGGGLGGLTATLALLRAGFDVDVYEQAPSLTEVGAGIQISANGSRVLYELGLKEALASLIFEPEGKIIRMWNTGETQPLFDLGVESIRLYGYPYFMLHRADLLDVLATAVRKEKPDAIHLNARCVDYRQDSDGVSLTLQDGTVIRGDVLIGADGIHSKVRETLFGTDQPRFTGTIAWRGLIRREDLPEHLHKPVGTNWVGPGGHVVHYFVRGGELLNFVGIRENTEWQVESWTAQGTTDECLRDFEGWHEDVQTLVRNINTPYKWALKVREPMKQWTQGRIALLGDACHSTLPYLAQGASMGFEDAVVLARCLAAQPDNLEVALHRYEEARRGRTSKIVNQSTEMGKVFHNHDFSDPEKARSYLHQQWSPEQIMERYRWLFTYDATAVPV